MFFVVGGVISADGRIVPKANAAKLANAENDQKP